MSPQLLSYSTVTVKRNISLGFSNTLSYLVKKSTNGITNGINKIIVPVLAEQYVVIHNFISQ